jgi:hypothetical protein
LTIYWLLFGYFALGSLLQGNRAGLRETPLSIMYGFGAVMIALAIGLRYEVGGDWIAYERFLSLARYMDLGEVLSQADPGYQFLNWLAVGLGGDIWLVNLICGSIFAWGLARFARTMPEPWLAVTIAIPYLVIVVAMGYSRQGVAIGVLMAGLAALNRGASIPRFVAFVVAAALFHKTAVVVLLLVLLRGRRNLLLNALLVAAMGFLFYDLLLEDSVGQLVENYLRVEYSSQGAAIRVAMCIVPAVLFFAYRNRLDWPENEDHLWRNFSFAAFALLVLLLATPSSTAVDRIALYILPLQLAVLARLPGIVFSERQSRLLIVLYSASILFVWLNYAVHASAWVPYRFYPF